MNWVYGIGLFLVVYFLWQILREDRLQREHESQKWQDYGLRIVRLEEFRTEHINAKLETNRRIADLAATVKDKIVEIHNFQDHLSRNDKDVIDLNRTFSKLRPIYKIVMPREEKIEKPKQKSRLRVSQ